jgi:hypothetical protein
MVIRTDVDDEKMRISVTLKKMKEIVTRVKRNGSSCENLVGE